ncbi:MAG: secretion system protein [Prochlorococcus sp. SP3034]|nr:secretion system protein [Prochlorococcus sp. SP3034]|tara:strand:- start:58 stop:507 length:450 start_codon:yes stop_codon:yes gene_type:complete
MKSLKDIKILLLAVGIVGQIVYVAPKTFAGSFGAEIFCTMRDGGNDHESSWEAAYSYIKRQKGGFFKTSPRQAAAQIIETVVRERDKFTYCVEYLNKLYPDRQLQRKIKEEEEKIKNEEIEKEKRRKRIDNLIDEEESLSDETFDRYSY